MKNSTYVDKMLNDLKAVDKFGSLSNRVDEENPLILFNSIQKGFITYVESI